MRKAFFSTLVLLLVVAACTRSQPQIIVVTSTPVPAELTPSGVARSPVPERPLSFPTPDPTRELPPGLLAQNYVVQPGDTLFGIAIALGVSLESLLSANDLPNPDNLVIGQIIVLPEAPTEQTNGFKLLPDSRLVRGPGSVSFDVVEFISKQPGYIRSATDIVDGNLLSAAEIIERIALNFSVDPRLLLILLEYRAGWLSNSDPDEREILYPLISPDFEPGIERSGLYRQLAWASDQLNLAYYGWKYRGLAALEFKDGQRQLYNPELNAGTVAIQYFLSRDTSMPLWQEQVGPNGFYQVYAAYFGDPFNSSFEPLVSPDVAQPPLLLPFASGETWFFTGSAHGGWGSGSAWASIDFAPPDERPPGSSACFVSGSWAHAVADGHIARSDDGVVVLDLDGDGDESTGWTIMYLHLAQEGRVPVGRAVTAGERLGRPSCEGGVSTATHLHIARRYNGEWIPATCHTCPPQHERPQFVLSNWAVVGIVNQEYQGFLVNGTEQRRAEQGRDVLVNRISW